MEGWVDGGESLVTVFFGGAKGGEEGGCLYG